jgi:hypothetical protein
MLTNSLYFLWFLTEMGQTFQNSKSNFFIHFQIAFFLKRVIYKSIQNVCFHVKWLQGINILKFRMFRCYKYTIIIFHLILMPIFLGVKLNVIEASFM